uniref:Uncharacterized protein n=1 Tax=Oryzias sinensis TaxID=183150 RepID=A0A8C7V8L0_9TELE
LCRFTILPFWLKPLWQNRQLKGFSPVCSRMWVSCALIDGNFLPQMLHVLLVSRWLWRCCLRLLPGFKLSPHTPQTHLVSLECFSACFSRKPLPWNNCPHTLQL